MCQLKKRSGSTLLLASVSLEVFPREISIRASRMNEKDQASPLPPPLPPLKTLRRGIEQRSGKKAGSFSLNLVLLTSITFAH